MRIKLPTGVKFILDTLAAQGKEAYIVGGCVRDAHLGRTPHDWDVCTSALPEETTSIFRQAGCEVISTGIQHGTVTVLANGEGYEVTTFREDGDYSDGRHPDGVKFVRSLRSDLARRDFTMNAMAYSPATGLVDPFNGRKDIKNKVIRCVGRPEVRFCEDALRIMRAVRFAAVTGFVLEDYTWHAAWCQANCLEEVAWERKQKELVALLQSLFLRYGMRFDKKRLQCWPVRVLVARHRSMGQQPPSPKHLRRRQCRETIPEVPMLGLVPEEEHPDGSSNSSSQESGPEQRFLRDTPPALFGICFIQAHECEGDKVN